MNERKALPGDGLKTMLEMMRNELQKIGIKTHGMTDLEVVKVFETLVKKVKK